MSSAENGTGQVVALHLAERTRQQSAAATAQQIMNTIAAAKTQLLQQFATATAETVGADSETGRMLITSLRQRLGTAGDDPERGGRR